MTHQAAMNNRIISVRPAHQCDAEAISASEREIFSDPWSESSISDALQNDNYTVLLALSDNCPAGYLIASTCVGESELCRIGVTPGFRRSGIAKALLDAFVISCRKNSVAEIFLEVRESNHAAIALYRSRGFEEYCRRASYYRLPSEDAIMMRLILDI